MEWVVAIAITVIVVLISFKIGCLKGWEEGFCESSIIHEEHIDAVKGMYRELIEKIKEIYRG